MDSGVLEGREEAMLKMRAVKQVRSGMVGQVVKISPPVRWEDVGGLR